MGARLKKKMQMLLQVPIIGAVVGARMNWLGFYTLIHATMGATMLAATEVGFMQARMGLLELLLG